MKQAVTETDDLVWQKDEERKLEDIKDKVSARQVSIQAQAEQMEAKLEKAYDFKSSCGKIYNSSC